MAKMERGGGGSQLKKAREWVIPPVRSLITIAQIKKQSSDNLQAEA